MNKIYILLFFLFSYSLSAQATAESKQLLEQEIPGFKLYPNPVYDGEVFIVTKNNREKDITVYNVFGEVVLMDRIKINRLDLSKLISGVYVLSVMEQQKSIYRKLVVK